MLKTYYMLTKPGIICGNLITTTSAFLLASKGHFSPFLFFAAVLGLTFIIAAACVFNNYIDRNYDQKMERTKNRPLATGAISIKKALIFATSLLALGSFFLFFYTNVLAASIALIGFFVYVMMYSFWKYKSSYGTLIGSIAGAVPPLVGYCAVSASIDIGALLLFTLLVLWQMPHFYAIAVYRLADYQAAKIPVLPLTKGVFATKIQMLLYILAFMAVSVLPLIYGLTGYFYLYGILAISTLWLLLALRGFQTQDDIGWAKGMFRVSLLVIMALSIMISWDVLI